MQAGRALAGHSRTALRDITASSKEAPEKLAPHALLLPAYACLIAAC
jgi:hypothetical protein